MSVQRFLGIAGLGAALVLSMAGQSLAAAGAATDKPLAGDAVKAEVRKIDKDNQKITLKHEEMKSFGMPAMTMVFPVSDPALLDKVKPGDKVVFRAGNEAGKLTVIDIQPAK